MDHAVNKLSDTPGSDDSTHSGHRISPIHPSIVQAICKIQTSLEAVKKSQRNQHGGYMFASTDDIYAAVTKKMGEVGLIVISREDECEIVRTEKDGKTIQWAKLVFSFVLATGEATWSDPHVRRSLYIQVTGPQTFQAAQSYAEKAYLRSLFKLPTGDMDLDAMPQAECEEEQIALTQPKKRKSSSGAKKDGTNELFNDIRAQIAGATTRDLLIQIRTRYGSEWAELPTRWAELLDQEYEDRLDQHSLTD